MSYATIFIPGSGVVDALGGATSEEFNQAFGLYLMVWFMITMMFMSVPAHFLFVAEQHLP